MLNKTIEGSLRSLATPPQASEPLQAYRVLEQPEKQKDMRKDDFMERHRAWCCSTVPEVALCGVSRIWVFSLARRQNIATRMLDTVRWVPYPFRQPASQR